MHAVRLHRSQAELLQSHQNWLKQFVNGTRLVHRPRTWKSGNTFGVRQVNTEAERPPIRFLGAKPKKRSQASKDAIVVEYHRHLHEAINANHTARVSEVYNSFPEKERLSAKDLGSIGQCIHYAVRLYNQTPKAQKKTEHLDNAINLASRLIQDTQEMKLAPAPEAYKHILGALKEAQCQDVGSKFWQWLETQDDEYLNGDVYGAAIELLATGDMPLSQLEELYSTCLTRYPGNFLAYHFSPNAIVPDRERAIAIGAIPVLLLLAIMTARLLRGDTRSAYMAFDTALRLYPAKLPNRFFKVLMNERPISEAFTVFAIACRSGQLIQSSLFRDYLGTLRHTSTLNSPQSHICIIRAKLASIYMYLGAGGPVKSNSDSELIIAITQILRLPGMNKLTESDRQEMVHHVMGLTRKIFESFARYEATPSISTFNSIITNVGGYGQSKETVDVALADMKRLGMKPNAVTRRSVLAAGGLLKDSELVRNVWMELIQVRQNESSVPDALDFIVLIKAARSTSQAEFAQEQLDAFKPEMPQYQISQIEGYVNAPVSDNTQTAEEKAIDLDVLRAGLRSVEADMDAINEQTRDVPTVLDFTQWPVPARLLPHPNELLASEGEMRRLYDELSTEQPSSSPTQTPLADGGEETSLEAFEPVQIEESQDEQLAPANEDKEPDVSLTNVPFGTLRYETWKDLNYLLALSEKHDREKEELVNKAIAEGKRPPRRLVRLTEQELSEMHAFGLSSFSQKTPGEVASRSEGADVQSARAEVLRLRGVSEEVVR